MDKHAHYEQSYKIFGYFWGLGVEHETYLKTNADRVFTSLKDRLRPERYSVAYYDAYCPAQLSAALERELATGALRVPVLLNSHSFTHCDLHGHHRTTYEKVPKPNPHYSNATLLEWAQARSQWLRTSRGYTWDGDAVEFITQNFYRATVGQVLQELRTLQEDFVRELNALPRQGVLAQYGPLQLAFPRNEPWAVYATNPANVAMFNNGTMHINVTLPTRLGAGCRPLWPARFLAQHRQLARLVQWLEPLWVAVHGSGDPFSAQSPLFARGSQRLAVGRYVALGTYDTEVMPAGKLLQIPREPWPWYTSLAAAYQPLAMCGLDLNYNKHFAHGLELRFFDQLPLEALREVLLQVAVLMDVACDKRTDVPNPTRDACWGTMAEAALLRGSEWQVEIDQLEALFAVLRITEQPETSLSAVEALEKIFRLLEPRRAFCWDELTS